jgi:N-acetylglucosaminyldiphosphoundecaprenol N-acetyl-beta-D-mannosaminyltransferase
MTHRLTQPQSAGPAIASQATHRRPGVRIGHVRVDAVTLDGALDAIEELIGDGKGGAVYTPNVDHIVQAERHAAFRAAYDRASLALPDGAPVVWASRVLGTPIPEKVSGSDLVWPLAHRAADCGWRVFLVGGLPGAAREAANRFRERCALDVVGVDDSRVDITDPASYAPLLERIRAARPDVVLVAFGAPKQELFIDRVRDAIRPAVAIGVGASLDFVAGRVRRAPAWMSRVGLEWFYRLCQEPRRLWRRYLVQDPLFAVIVLRGLRRAAHEPTGRSASRRLRMLTEE